MAIDLARVPLPDVVETLSYEGILADAMEYLKDRFAANGVDYDLGNLETDPAKIILEAFCAREMLLRARINDAAKALMLSTTSGADLDNFASDFGMTRRVVGRFPDGKAIYENDEEFRQRRNLAPDGYAAAGPEDAYRYYAWSVDGVIKQVKAIKGLDNRCDIILLGRDGDGTVPQEIVAKVYAALSPKTRRPLTDSVYVRSATIVSQTIRVKITAQTGPDVSTVAARTKASIEAYAQSRSSIGKSLRVDGIIGAAHLNNALETVQVIEPSADVDPGVYGTVFVPEVTIEVD